MEKIFKELWERLEKYYLENGNQFFSQLIIRYEGRNLISINGISWDKLIDKKECLYEDLNYRLEDLFFGDFDCNFDVKYSFIIYPVENTKNKYNVSLLFDSVIAN